jgi:CheY-like chemotaxis protein
MRVGSILLDDSDTDQDSPTFSSKSLFQTSEGKHVMLLYDSNERCANAATSLINSALEAGQVCVYASVHAIDESSDLSFYQLSKKVTKCQENIDRNNLLVVDFKPYYESALKGDFTLFRQLKERLESISQKRADQGYQDGIMVFADAACFLSENKYFEESEKLEDWWQNVHDEWKRNNYRISVICPHPDQAFAYEKSNVKAKIGHRHDLKLNLRDFGENMHTNQIGRSKRILIAESDLDLRNLYSEYFKYLNLDVVVVGDGNSFISTFSEQDFDIVILDTHVGGRASINDVVKEIRRIKPNLKIVLTTTDTRYQLHELLDEAGTDESQLLVKPFVLSQLSGVVN